MMTSRWRRLSCVAVLALAIVLGSVSTETRPNVAANGMVASPEPFATDVGVAILKAGGNAFDAAAAVQLALAAGIKRTPEGFLAGYADRRGAGTARGY